MRRALVFFALVLGACHKDSPVGTYDLAAPHAPLDLLAAPVATPLVTLDGKAVDLAAYRKRVTLLALWGTFCEPCIDEMPLLEALHDKTKDDTDLAIVGVSLDAVPGEGDRAHVAEVAARLKVTFPMLIDKDGVLNDRFGHKDGDRVPSAPDGGDDRTMALPTTVLLLADGHYSRHSGFDLRASSDAFVSDGLATIARAEAGTLPEDHYDDSRPPPDASRGGTFKMMFPAMSRVDFAENWPGVKKDLKDKMHLSEKSIADAEAQLRTGRPAVIEMTPSGTSSPVPEKAPTAASGAAPGPSRSTRHPSDPSK